jgi:hypothetical protein
MRDNQLHTTGQEQESAEQSLPTQVLSTLHSLSEWHYAADLQCHCLTVRMSVD